MKPLDALGVLFCVSCLTACSVKEDREDCPCLLMLDLKDNDTTVVGYAEVFWRPSGGSVFSDIIENGSFSEVYEAFVPRGVVDVMAFSGTDADVWGIEGVKIPYGDDCPHVYMHYSKVEAIGESVSEEILLRKNHCVLTINVVSEGEYPFALCVEGDVDGYGPDGVPSSGPFSYVPELDKNNSCEVCLPRQMGSSLRLNLYTGADVVRSFSLGKYIAETGYDWNALDLMDIMLTIDYSLSVIELLVSDWDNEYSFDIVL